MLRRSGFICAGLLALASAPSHAIPAFDTASRAAVASAYTDTYVPLFSVAPGWSGNVGTCTEGTTSAEHQQATIDAANFYRVMAGLPQVNLVTDTTAVLRARKAALMMAANGALSHTPTSGSFPTCFSTSGADGALASNLTLGGASAPGGTFYANSTGPGAIAGYINDTGNGGEITGGQLGHRRWVLYSKAIGFATGDIPNTATATGGYYYSANALRVMPNQSDNDGRGYEAQSLFWGAAPAPNWVAWPSPKFVPYQMIPSSGYWSVSYPGATFSAATTVTMSTAGGVNVPVQVYRLGPAPPSYMGDNTLQFNPTLPSAPAGGMADTSYKVEVRGAAGAPDFCYTVTIFDPAHPLPPYDDAAPDLCNNPGALQNQTITFGAANPSPVTVGDTYTPSATASSSLPVTFSVADADACSLAAGQVTFIGFTGGGSGACHVTATQAGDTNYNRATQTQTITVNKKSQTIAFDAMTPTTASAGDNVPLLAAASSGLTVTYGTTSAASVCTLSPGVVTANGAGTCQITADQPGDNDWAAAPQATWVIAIGFVPQTITFNPPTTAWVGIHVPLSATGGGSGNQVVFTVASGSAAVCYITTGTILNFTSVGTCVINANQAGDATYAPASQVQLPIMVSKQSQTITFSAQVPASRDFASAPGNTFALNPLATTDAAGLSVTYTSDTPAVCSISGATVTMNTAGTCTIAANQSGNATYASAAPVTQNITIAKANQTVTITSLNPRTVAAGDTYTVTASASSGLPVALSVTGDCTLSGSVVTFTGPGTCTVNADQDGNASYVSYQVTQIISILNKQVLTITSPPPAPPIAVGDTYTVTAALTGAAGGSVGDITFSIDPSTSGACTVDSSTGVVTFTATMGNCIVIAQAAGTIDYAPAQVQQIIVLGPIARGGATAIPALDPWALGLLAALSALLALPAFRRRAAARR
ncbi:MAG: IPTL-CTERM sorting domain-containing protein [Burkholderiaceae bacterium]|nr:IPTL-CTERM sorting domain-containing protein [Burkholderiaceae bacterium]